MGIKFKQLDPAAKLPQRAYSTDTGLDIFATSVEYKDKYIVYGTGLAAEMPSEYGLQIRPRSSISDYDLMICNAPGTIDNSYRGEIKIRFRALCDNPKIYKVGDKIAQLVVEKVWFPRIEWADELTPTDRSGGGFGSTGK
jgi:dUTP pyrophosphatase